MSTYDAPQFAYRTTRDGRRLTYQLTVIQQPDRARACGSGLKYPPPIVEFRLFQEVGEHKRKDVTFSYDANFLLYAYLEAVKTVPNARNAPAANQQSPVLTGMPVSGMAYLDRPREAGYFIFPDLSVRHEGKYRLRFCLYEETKVPGDRSADEAGSSQVLAPEGSFDWRLDIRSQPFVVFSAKKFPGLTESTPLSKIISEQGCRVRIRRDVRMRRREPKGVEESYDHESNRILRGRSTTPSGSKHDSRARQRSVSADRTPLKQERRSSDNYVPQSQPAHYAAPPPASAQMPPHSQYASAQHPSQPRLSYSSQSPYPSGSSGDYYTPNIYNRTALPASSQGYAHDSTRANVQEYTRTRDTHDITYDRAPFDDYSRRSSTLPYSATATQFPGYNRNNSVSYYQPPAPPHHYFGREYPASGPVALAPLKLKVSAIAPGHEGVSPSAQIHPIPLQITPAGQKPDRINSYSSFGNVSSPAPSPVNNGKRTYDTAFSDSSAIQQQPLYNGMRPSAPDYGLAAFDSEDADQGEGTSMVVYKRADGTAISRALPVLL